MEHSDYELVRYPSGQLVIMRVGTNAQGLPASGPRDVIGAFADETEAQRALARLVASQNVPGRTVGAARRG